MIFKCKGLQSKNLFPAGVPGPPLNVEPLDWDKNFVDLKWDPPASDGGAPVLRYVIERKVKE